MMLILAPKIYIIWLKVSYSTKGRKDIPRQKTIAESLSSPPSGAAWADEEAAAPEASYVQISEVSA